ncbi:MAG: uracil-DNA glycosylase [Gammaproteobacteria bacterium]|nr:uracil-DNA glycosylase [Gammaproteobacteria bacterium]
METPLRLAYLDAMGIRAWVPRTQGAAPAIESPTSDSSNSPRLLNDGESAGLVMSAAPSAPSTAVRTAPTLQLVTSTDGGEPPQWSQLRQAVSDCKECSLCESRTQTVFGVGDRKASWMIIGEAPGADEDRQGKPFVGRAGKLLDAMLMAAGFRRDQVFIANVLKCRPPDNRDPHQDEIAACSTHLDKQIELVRPDLILAVGRIAAQSLLQTQMAVGRLRGIRHVHAATSTPVVVTYHPAYLLRKPSEKGKAWSDLRLAMASAGRGR